MDLELACPGNTIKYNDMSVFGELLVVCLQTILLPLIHIRGYSHELGIVVRAAAKFSQWL